MDLDLDQLQKAAESGNTGGLFANFDAWTLFFGFAFGVIGWWIFKQARKKGNPGLLVIGIALMVYPYFVTNRWACLLVGAGLCFGARKIWDLY